MEIQVGKPELGTTFGTTHVFAIRALERESVTAATTGRAYRVSPSHGHGPQIIIELLQRVLLHSTYITYKIRLPHMSRLQPYWEQKNGDMCVVEGL
jgi:hypothetical protein